MQIISTETASRQGMPALPNDWYYEQHAFDPNVVHIVWPEHGAVSVNFKHRTIATGWVIPGAADLDKGVPGGKGWRAALVNDAVGLFQSVWS